MNTNSVAFGLLTAKKVQNVPVWEFDLDKDGIINLDEYLKAVENFGLDFLDISTIDKDKDQKITKEEYDLWTQEEKINKLFEEAKTNAVADFVGQDNDDIVKFLAALDDFKQSFMEQQVKNMTDISEWAEKFAQQLPVKYEEIKHEMLANTKSAIKLRVIDNVIEKINTDSINSDSGIFGNSNKVLSDNARRLLGNILLKEADKFAKKYDGDDFEKDLTSYLADYLSKSDKEKLADAIFIWEKDFESIANQQPEVALKQMKDKARNLILAALENGITLTMGCVTIRTEVGITPALAQYRDIDTLLYAIKGIIKSLSVVSKLQEIINETDGIDKQEATDVSAELFVKKEENVNFFRTFQAA